MDFLGRVALSFIGIILAAGFSESVLKYKTAAYDPFWTWGTLIGASLCFAGAMSFRSSKTPQKGDSKR